MPYPTRGKSIRLKCLDCCAGNSAEVRLCTSTKCPLWGYRMGAGPLTARAIQANLLAREATPGLPEGYPGCYGK